MDDFSVFTDGERAVLEALNRHHVPFMLVGLSAAEARIFDGSRDPAMRRE